MSIGNGWSFLLYITGNVGEAAVQDSAQVTQCIGGDRFVFAQALDGAAAHFVRFPESVGGEPLLLHGIPQRRVNNHMEFPFFVMIVSVWAI